MSFIELQGIEDVQEAITPPDGEYEFVIGDVLAYHKEESNNDLVRVRCDIQGQSDEGLDYEPVYHYLTLPKADDDAEKVKTKLRMIKRFLHMVGVPFDGGFTPEDLYGATFVGRVRVVTDDNERETANLVLPKFKG